MKTIQQLINHSSTFIKKEIFLLLQNYHVPHKLNLLAFQLSIFIIQCINQLINFINLRSI
jgi:hypothetical protein